MENSDAPGVLGEPGGHRASGRGRDSPDSHFFFAEAIRYLLILCSTIITVFHTFTSEGFVHCVSG